MAKFQTRKDRRYTRNKFKHYCPDGRDCDWCRGNRTIQDQKMDIKFYEMINKINGMRYENNEECY